MLLEVLTITFALAFGLTVKKLNIPPLVGFLAAGFALGGFGPRVGLPDTAGPVLEHLAELGVLLLLFTVGLKLKLKYLVQPHVIGTGLLHFAVTTILFAGGFFLFLGLAAQTALLLGIALSFSSTVLAAKVLEGKRELTSFHGRTAISILIIQDIVAIATLSIFGDYEPSPWIAALAALPLLRPLLYWLLDAAGHDELLVLVGLLMALVLGGWLFQRVGLSAELGALVMGVLLGNHGRAQELGEVLWGLKELFLVGFFLQIGLTGLPDWGDVAFAAVVVPLVFAKGALFYALLVAFGLRGRNAFLGGLSLTAYSEFGLIVAASVLTDWLVPLALVVSVSFVIAAPLNHVAHALSQRLERQLARWQRTCSHPDEVPLDIGDAEVMVLGMGSIGTAAYDDIVRRGYRAVGIDSDPKTLELADEGRDVRYADAADVFFWHRLVFGNLQAVVLALEAVEAKEIAIRELRRMDFRGAIISHALHSDAAERIRTAGADAVYLTMREAGYGLGEHTCSALTQQRQQTS